MAAADQPASFFPAAFHRALFVSADASILSFAQPDNLRVIIRGLPGCAKLKIEASALTNSARWKAAGKKLAG